MGRERLLSVASQIELRKIREDNLTEEERKKLAETKADLALCRFTIRDMIAPSLSEVIALIEKRHNEDKAEVVIIDYLGLIKDEEKDILKELKALAERLGIAVIALQQIPRGSGEVNIDIEQQGDAMKIVVSDTGIGIPMADQSRVFERFYRVDKGRSKQRGGTGLGLAIVKHMVSNYKGTIELTSEINKGTTITIILPQQTITE